MSGQLLLDGLSSRRDPAFNLDHLSAVRLFPGGPSPDIFSHQSFYHRGSGLISGTVTISGAGGVARRVLLFDRLTGALVDATWSEADGSYTFESYDASKEYLVVAIDHTKTYNAARADAVVPE